MAVRIVLQNRWTTTWSVFDTWQDERTAGGTESVCQVCKVGVEQGLLVDRGQSLIENVAEIRAFFVTVDPERDTPEMLGDYVSRTEAVTGVSGSREEIDKAIRAFRVYAQKVPLKDGGYTMDHSAMVLLFDEDGRFFQPISYQEDPERAVGKIRSLLAG